MLEKIMNNRAYKYLNENNLPFKEQFGFQKGHSTESVIIQLVDQFYSSFNKNIFTLRVFAGLFKAFGTVDLEILISRLEKYGVRGNNRQCFRSYVSNW